MEPHRHLYNLPHFPACDSCRGCVVGMCMALASCASAPRLEEPLTIAQAKSAVSTYCDSGAYQRDVEVQVGAARAWLAERAARRSSRERLAAIFDVDETALSNAPFIRRLDFAYLPAEWDRWIASAASPAITPVRDLFHFALGLGVAVIFVTGRAEPSDRQATEENLRREGFHGYERMIMADRTKPARNSAERKAESRRRLAAEGFTLVANIGDQESDLRGGYSERTFRLPGPFYLVE